MVLKLITVKFVRNVVRPWLMNVFVFGWIMYRCMRVVTTFPSFSSSTSSSSYGQEDPTLLQLLVDGMNNVHGYVMEHSVTPLLEAISKYGGGNEQQLDKNDLLPPLLTAKFLTILLPPLITFGFHMVQDLLAILAVLGLCRTLYVLYHFPMSLHEFSNYLQTMIFNWSKTNIPQVRNYIEIEKSKMIPGMKKSLCITDYNDDNNENDENNNNLLIEIPSNGRDRVKLFHTLQSISQKEHLESWQTGKHSGTVYVGDNDNQHLQLMNQIYGLYAYSNTLHPGIWPKLNQCEAELISMTATMLHAPSPYGCTTSGGTESIMLAIKAHLIYYGKHRSITHPELICGSTAHAAVDKACEIFSIRKVVVDCNSDDPSLNFTLNPTKVRNLITSNTIMIYASAPNYPQGTIDPIEELSQIAIQYDIGLHVDACLGGFVLPFVSSDDDDLDVQPKFPKFDFQVPGVTSMSADTHKFGYAPKGTSIILYRYNELRHCQYFCYSQWTGGIYATPTFAGSRPSALVGCAWASLVTIGQHGFQKRTKQIVDASQYISRCITKDIPELQVLGKQRPSMVVCFASLSNGQSTSSSVGGGGGGGGVDIYRIADAMKVKGWSLNSLQNPPSVHVCVTLALAPKAKEFVHDLKSCVREEVEVMNNEKGMHVKKKGTAGMYGMAGSLPEGPVNDFLSVFLDLMLTT